MKSNFINPFLANVLIFYPLGGGGGEWINMSTVKNNWVTQCSRQSNMDTSNYRKLMVSGTQPHLSENLWFSNDFRVSKSGHIGLNSLNM